MEIPQFSVRFDSAHGITAELEFDGEMYEDMYFVHAIIAKHITDTFMNEALTPHILSIIDSSCNMIVNDLIEKAYLYEDFLFDKWRFDSVKFVLDKFGYKMSRRFSLSKSYVDPQCVIGDHVHYLIFNGTLCTQLQKMPSEFIEKLSKIFRNKYFDAAVKEFKNKMILELAGVPEQD